MTEHLNRAPEERWTHGTKDEIGADGIQRVQRPVEVLRRAGKIDDAAVAAADRYYRDYAIGWEAVGGESSPSGDPYTAYYGARAAVGFPGVHLLAFAVLQDVTVDAIAEFYGLPWRRIQVLLIATLDTLTTFYTKLDGTRPAPEAPIRSIGVK